MFDMAMFLYRQNSILLKFIIATVASLLFVVSTVFAHTPHDPIDAIELSPSYCQDKTLFIIIGEHLLKSTDGGFSWKEMVNGLDNRYPFSSIAVSPLFTKDGKIYISSKGDGIYRSDDQGVSWVKTNKGLNTLNITLVSVSSSDNSAKIVLAALNNGGLFKTENGGESWYQIIDDKIKITAVAFLPHDKEGNKVIIGDNRGNLYHSEDAGENWQKDFQFPNSGSITSIAAIPNVSSFDTYFVGTEKRGVFKTTDGGASFVEACDGISDRNMIDIAISPDYEVDGTIIASSWHEAVFKSTDSGDTWVKFDKGITTDPQADTVEYSSPHFRNARFSNGFSEDRTVFLGGFDGLFMSSDGGNNWVQMETLPVRLIKGMAVSPGDKDRSSIAITTYGGGAYLTKNQGKSWSVINRGLKTTRLSDIVFSPDYFKDNTIFSASIRYVLKSTDCGDNWKKIKVRKKSLRHRVRNVLTRLGMPRDFTRELLFTSSQISPIWPTAIGIPTTYSKDGTIYFGTREHGVFKLMNGVSGAQLLWDCNDRTVTSIAISPAFPSDKTIFIGVRAEGIYKSVDGGNTWHAANKGLLFVDEWAKSLTVHDITKKDVNLIMSPGYLEDKTVFAASSMGLFKTIDCGKSWSQLELSAFKRTVYVVGIAISPNYSKDQTLIISVKGKGLFKTTDGGLTFIEIAPDLIHNNYSIELIHFSESFATDNSIYAASDEELFVSTDKGNTWEHLKRPVRYENHRDVVYYEGGWDIIKGDEYSASSITASNLPNDKAMLIFVGKGVRWIGTTADDHGIARVYIDGKHMADVDQFNGTRRSLVKLYSIADLPCGPHIITVEISNKKNPKSSGYRIEIDAFDILP